jgi:hypothetical protein
MNKQLMNKFVNAKKFFIKKFLRVFLKLTHKKRCGGEQRGACPCPEIFKKNPVESAWPS